MRKTIASANHGTVAPPDEVIEFVRAVLDDSAQQLVLRKKKKEPVIPNWGVEGGESSPELAKQMRLRNQS